MPCADPQTQRVPASCRVGDWVLATTIPEWDMAKHRHYVFVPPKELHQPPTPEEEPAVTSFLPQWTFTAGRLTSEGLRCDILVWIRES